MPIELRHIKVSELVSYIASEACDAHEFYTISKLRAISHANNPRSDGSETALILAYDDARLVGYLGAIPEYVFFEGNTYKACWFSCMWVLPEYRRAGIAKLLLEEGSSLYNHNVCITNYIPQSKAAFLKNDQFREVGLLTGVRAYLRFDLQHILARKRKYYVYLKPLLWAFDYGGNRLLSLAYVFRMKRWRSEFTFQTIRSLSGDLEKFIYSRMKDSVFKRGARELTWLLEYPWIGTKKMNRRERAKYYFSQYSSDFRQWALQISETTGRIRGFVLLTRHRHELKTPYVLCDGELMPDLFRYIYRLMLENGVRTLVTHHRELAAEVRKHRGLFLYMRNSKYGFMATPAMVERVRGNFGQLYDGDGDGMFT